MKPNLLILVAVIFLLVPVSARAGGVTLDLKAGTMFAGGSIGYTLDDQSRETDGYTYDDISSGVLFSPLIPNPPN